MVHYKLVYIYIYIYIKKIPKLRENLIRFQIGIQLDPNFVPCIPSNLSFKYLC